MPYISYRQRIFLLSPILFFVGSFAVLFASHFSLGARSAEGGLAHAKSGTNKESADSFSEEAVTENENGTNITDTETGNRKGSREEMSTEQGKIQDAFDAEGTENLLATYPIHHDISTTFFWIGEDASDDNKNISNSPSAWDDSWKKHYGGIDDPKKRSGFFPSKFTPKENPFYIALPYNDFDEKGKRKSDVQQIIPWAKDAAISDDASYCKNRWIKIMKNGKTAYAQWEDVGPFGEDDSDYVFGSAEPKSKTNKHAGLDVSPAVHDYLDLHDVDKVDWAFVDESDVPDGPWKKIITTSGVYWK